MRIDNHHPYAYIERGRALVASAQLVSDILTDQVVLGTREGLADAFADLADQVERIRRQVSNTMRQPT